jgi:hypothetical protein
VNAVDPLGLCSTSGGTFLVSGACHWTSRSWVSQTENTLQGQKGGGFSITNGLKAVADYGAGIGNAAVSTLTLGHVHVAPPYCGFGWASDVGMGYGYVALGVLGGGAGGAAEVSDGAATVEEVEAEGQAAEVTSTAGPGTGIGPGAARVDDPSFSEFDLYHGTDADSAGDIAENGLSRASAAELGGGDSFWMTKDLDTARLFAQANPAGADEAAVVGINVSGGVANAVSNGVISEVAEFPGTYVVNDWEGFNAIADFSVLDG